MLDRVPTCEPLTCTTVNWPILQRTAHLLGRSPFEMLDKENNKSRSLWGFLACIGEIFRPGLQSRTQVIDNEFSAKLVHLSFLCSCYTDDLISLIEDCDGLNFKQRELDKYRTIFILSGTLAAFRRVLFKKYSIQSSYYARLFFERIKIYLEREDLLPIMTEQTLPDGSHCF